MVSLIYGSLIYICVCYQCLLPLKIMSSINANNKVYLMQLYVIKFVSNLRQVCGFLLVFPLLVSSTNKTDLYSKIEILLKAVLTSYVSIIFTLYYS